MQLRPVVEGGEWAKRKVNTPIERGGHHSGSGPDEGENMARLLACGLQWMCRPCNRMKWFRGGRVDKAMPRHQHPSNSNKNSSQ